MKDLWHDAAISLMEAACFTIIFGVIAWALVTI